MTENNYADNFEGPIQELSDEELNSLSRDDLIVKFKQLQSYVNVIEKQNREYLKKFNSKLFEIAKLKNLLMNTISLTSLANNQQKEADNPATLENGHQQSVKTSKQSTSFVDPCVNALIIELKKELDELKKKKDDLQNELNSIKFTPESQITKRLMFKCNKLLEENEEIGKMISSGNLAQLENDLAYHKQLLSEANDNEQNINGFLLEMDNEMDLMQANILMYQENLAKNSSN